MLTILLLGICCFIGMCLIIVKWTYNKQSRKTYWVPCDPNVSHFITLAILFSVLVGISYSGSFTAWWLDIFPSSLGAGQ